MQTVISRFQTLHRPRDGTGIIPAKESVERRMKKIGEITKSKRGISLQSLLKELNPFIRGWAGYYGLSTSDYVLETIDGWMCRK